MVYGYARVNTSCQTRIINFPNAHVPALLNLGDQIVRLLN